MKARNFLTAGAMALLLTGWGALPAMATTTGSQGESLAGVGNVDVWEIKCKGPSTALHAQVSDEGTPDDQYIITTIALTPANIKADADTERNTLGSLAFSPSASAIRLAGAGLIKAWVTVSQIIGGGGAYTLQITCTNTNIVPDFKLLQDQ
jgi:hypothetical protein